MAKYDLDIAGWKARQEALRDRVVRRPIRRLPRFVAGVDCAFADGGRRIVCAALVWDRRRDEVVDEHGAVLASQAPYVPGFLSFREGPAVAAAVGGLTHPFGAVLFDGQGLAHPRRCGLATHMGVELGLVSVGVAKSRLIGTHDDPGPAAGDAAPLLDKGERIGTVLRTRDRVRPIYVSIGHRVDLPSAVRLVLACCTRYRVPEPTRRADIAVARMKRELA